jgi:crossover junction endodeoxyribonuclease RuvC
VGAVGDPLRILGVVPGARHTGWGIIEKIGSRVVYVDAGAISPPPRLPFEERLRLLYEGLGRRIEVARPQQVAVEDIFHAVNVRSALQLAHVRGVLLLAAAQAGLPVTPYAPRLVKQAVVGNGSADKEQVAWMVGRLLAPAATGGRQDVTDALAVALCHAAHHGPAAAAATAGDRTLRRPGQ